jgi:hypothetical protein
MTAAQPWRAIATADHDASDHVLVWNGHQVTLAWCNDTSGEWIDATDPQERALDPQPIAWQPKPEGPADGGVVLG